MDKMFEAVSNKSYLPQPEQETSVVKVERDEQKKDEVITDHVKNIFKIVG